MVTHRKSARRYGRNGTPRHAALTSDRLILRGSAPSPAEIRSALDCLNRCAAHMERSEHYAQSIAIDCLSHGHRLDLLRAAVVLAFKSASPDTVWDAAEHILVPLVIGLCQGQHETGNIMGTGMSGSDGRDHLRDLDRDEGEPLSRIIDAIARYCPQELFGLPESSND